jgi:hypothetical protein
MGDFSDYPELPDSLRRDPTGAPAPVEPTPTKASTGWKEQLPIHPACDILPPLSENEYRALVEDIRKATTEDDCGIRTPVAVQWAADLKRYVLLDGRHRLDAVEEIDEHTSVYRDKYTGVGGLYVPFTIVAPEVDAYDYVLSANVHRRHLTAENKHAIITKILKAKPELADRAIADKVKTDKNVVSRIRRKAESTGEVSPVEKRTGMDGKARTTKPKDPEAKPAGEAERAEQERVRQALREEQEARDREWDERKKRALELGKYLAGICSPEKARELIELRNWGDWIAVEDGFFEGFRDKYPDDPILSDEDDLDDFESGERDGAAVH